MLSKEKKGSRLSREIAGMIIASAAVSFFLFLFLEVISNSIAMNYMDGNGIYLDEEAVGYLQVWVAGVSFAAAVIVFFVIFMFLLGQKFQYLKQIIEGVEALSKHRMDYQMPLEGNNELTELAAAINYLSETERTLKTKEQKLAEEREQFIRAMSHDIRTPLTSIISYSEIVGMNPDIKPEEIKRYADMVQKKAVQIRDLSGKLIQGADEGLVEITNGRLLMQQLAEEWLCDLEEDFECQIDYENCPDFSGRINVGDFKRIFDNLSSNIRKYADSKLPVNLVIDGEENMLEIRQSNMICILPSSEESHGIGLKSIRRIAENCGGSMEAGEREGTFFIKILFSLEFFRIS